MFVQCVRACARLPRVRVQFACACACACVCVCACVRVRACAVCVRVRVRVYTHKLTHAHVQMNELGLTRKPQTLNPKPKPGHNQFIAPRYEP